MQSSTASAAGVESHAHTWRYWRFFAGCFWHLFFTFVVSCFVWAVSPVSYIVPLLYIPIVLSASYIYLLSYHSILQPIFPKFQYPLDVFGYWCTGLRLVYVIVCVVTSVVIGLSLMILHGSTHVHWWLTSCSARDGYCINLEGMYVTGFFLVLGLAHGLGTLLHGEAVLVFPSVQQPRWPRFRDSHLPVVISSAITLAIKLSLTYLVLSLVVYLLVDNTLVRPAVAWLFSGIVEGVDVHPSHMARHIGLFTQLLLAGAILAACQRFGQHILQVMFTFPTTFYLPSHDLNQPLLYALHGKTDPWIHRLALYDLLDVATYDAHRRQLLYRDSKGKAWGKLLDLCISKMDATTTALQQLAKGRSSVSPEGKDTSIIELIYQLTTPMSLRRSLSGFYQRSFNPAFNNPDAYSTYKKTDEPAPAPQSALQASINARSSKLKSQTAAPPDAKSTLPSAPVIVMRTQRQALDMLLLRAGIGATAVHDQVISDIESTVVFARAVCDLTAKSRTEDTIGIVQNDNSVPSLLLSIMNLISSAENAIHRNSSIPSSPTPRWPWAWRAGLMPSHPPAPRGAMVHQHVSAHLLALVLALRQCIHVLAGTFKDSMGYLKLDPMIQAKVQDYLKEHRL
eukprot:TRINITY_DN3978_c0_g1_i4.p1 TRINITY_DN3978_c0_g1~~TRINITY_DN3978_c0_g1_i4.p1  ORF type:complete len:638 (-),score=84.24 TRINITY_DN3978_c0_g1_i4:40-1908(-)